MATASTKSRDGKRAARGSGGAFREEAPPPPPKFTELTTVGEEVSRRAWLFWCLAVFAVALLLRVPALELRPMHHDEGVNGFFLLNLMRQGAYQYNPTNYHGPTLYYFALPLAHLADKLGFLGTWVVRLVPLAFGVATIWLVLGLRRYVGAVGALAAGALLAVSPGMVFFSRYFIHEMPFVFFTLGTVVGALRFYEGEPKVRDGEARTTGGPLLGAAVVLASAVLVAATLGAVYYPQNFKALVALVVVSAGSLAVLLWLYDGARSLYLLLAGVSAGLLFATKETAFISAGVLLIAWASAEAWVRISWRLGWSRPREAKRKKGKERRAAQPAVQPEPYLLKIIERAGGWPRLLVLLAAAAGAFLFINFIYYSSFFTNAKGVKDSVEALAVWRKTGESGFHGYPVYKYVEWLVWGRYGQGYDFGEEAPLVLLAVAGAIFSLWRTRRRFPVFAALWGFGTLAAYSLIKYKTPWLALNALLPFALAGGYAVERLYRRRGWRAPSLAALGLCAAIAAYQAYVLNFEHYDDDRYVYVYAHTKREFNDMIAEMDRLAAAAGGKAEAGLNVAVENQEYWPLPWYVRDYKRVGYVGQLGETNDPILLVKTTQAAEVESRFGGRYRRVGTYALRPGVDLVLYARNDVTAR